MRTRDLLLVLAAPAFAATSLVAAEAPAGRPVRDSSRSRQPHVEGERGDFLRRWESDARRELGRLGRGRALFTL